MDSLGGLHPVRGVLVRAAGRLTLMRVVGYDVGRGPVRPASYLVTVSGGASDGPGLRAILRHVTPTVFSTP
ncbi:hypothetical protein FE634_21040 [Nocardioides dongxiaopingii]|uniref:hypothetical protein n=1 Tax=Nocardioides sp. S-1144 TaxID=2582905 RepID=UPI00110EA3E1|nr:hypothetical protein [Nocardioides sp. S-1144]QCW52292.1 hypothetical protein FE634_21040 [Nocardioides sp. S-1144]